MVLLPRDAVHSADYTVARCLSVTRRYCVVETAKHIIKLIYRRVASRELKIQDTHHSSFVHTKRHSSISTRPPNGGVECRRYEKIAIFDQYLAFSPK